MRVLFLSPCGNLGGAERALLDLLASLRHSQPSWPLHLITGAPGPLITEAQQLGVASSCLPFPKTLSSLGLFGAGRGFLLDALRAIPALAAYRRCLRAEIDRVAPDVVHTNGFKMHLLAAADGSVPVVWHLHDYLSSRPAAARLLRLFSPGCDGAIAVSRSVAVDSRRQLPRRVPISTLLNGVDLQRFHPAGPRCAFAQENSASPGLNDALKVGLIGTFATWKGHETFLHAIAHPHLRDLPLRAFIIGGPIYETRGSQHSFADLERLAARLGVSHRVTFPGFIDSAAAMRSLDIVVHASTRPEPFGLVIAEAMACGRPVVVSQTGGAAELFKHGHDAVGFQPGDTRALAAIIKDLALNPSQRANLGRAARATSELRFNRDRLGPALASTYRQFLLQCEYSTSTAEISTAA